MLENINRRGSVEGRTYSNGVIYVAEHEGRVIGVIAGIVFQWSGESLLEASRARKVGRILELFVDPAHRGQNVGTMLMEKIEVFFKQNGCDVSRVEVFGPNVKAYRFYHKLGYHDRTFDMIKKL